MTTNMRVRAKTGKGNKPAPLPPIPCLNDIFVVQFQFFDNGPKPGSGKTQYQFKIEAYMTRRYDLYKPDWSRVVPLISGQSMIEWAATAVADGRIPAELQAGYEQAGEWAIQQSADPDVDFAMVGRIEDRRSHTTYPGHIMMVRREKSGPMTVVLMKVQEGEVIKCDRFIHDKYARPGAGRRKAFGFYDPLRLRENEKAEADAVASGRPIAEVKAERGLV